MSRNILAFVLIAVLLVGVCHPLAFGTVTVTSTGSSAGLRLSVNRSMINDSTGTVTLVPGVSGQRIKVWGCTLATASNTTMEFKSGSSSLTGPMAINAIQVDAPVSGTSPDSGIPWLVGASGDAIVLTLGDAIQVTGQVMWTQQ